MTLFAFLLFAIIPLMSLVIHVGLITLTRRQMQTAVNTAALEGLRFRDDAEIDSRQAASDIAGMVFDDDLNPNNGTGSYRLGVGPDVQFDGGIALPDTDFRASAIITSAAPYQPLPLQLNSETNHKSGDMVAGNYDATVTDHEETDLADGYFRQDFTPVSSDDAQGGNFDSFLVRMRRSGETFSGNIGTNSEPVPFLFGRGPFGNSDWMNRIERGTIVPADGDCPSQPGTERGSAVGVPVGGSRSFVVGIAELEQSCDGHPCGFDDREWSDFQRGGWGTRGTPGRFRC